MMMIAAARALKDDDVCFVGIGMPSAACNLARLTHAPNITLIYESGTIGAKPYVLPLSIGDPELCETAVTTVPVPEMFAYWLQSGQQNRRPQPGRDRSVSDATACGDERVDGDVCAPGHHTGGNHQTHRMAGEVRRQSR